MEKIGDSAGVFKQKRTDRLRLGLRAKRAGVALAQWIIKPDSDLLLVLNRGWIKTLERYYTSQLDRATVKPQDTFLL